MAGVSSQAAGKLESLYKANGSDELQHKEFSDGSGLEAYDASFRMYDAQIGRFWQIDPLSELTQDQSPYSFVENNPINYIDPFGLDTVDVKGKVGQTVTTSSANDGSGTWVITDNGPVGTGITGSSLPDVVVRATSKKSSNQSSPNPDDSQSGSSAADQGSSSSGGGSSSGSSSGSGGTTANPTPGDPLKQPDSKGPKNFRISKAIFAMEQNAQPNSLGQCAKYVRFGLEAGGVNTNGHPIAAKDYGPFLTSRGFATVSPKNYNPNNGDVVVMNAFQGAKKFFEYGHIEMYCRGHWISDFSQRGFWPGADYRNFTPDYKIFRAK
jgi:RHS repeat-associated protein